MPSYYVESWIKTIQQDLKSNNLSLNEAIDVAHNCPLQAVRATMKKKTALIIKQKFFTSS